MAILVVSTASGARPLAAEVGLEAQPTVCWKSSAPAGSKPFRELNCRKGPEGISRGGWWISGIQRPQGLGKHVSSLVDRAVADIRRFRRADPLAAYVRCVPKQNSTGKGAAPGEHERQPQLKEGNRYLQRHFYLADQLHEEAGRKAAKEKPHTPEEQPAEQTTSRTHEPTTIHEVLKVLAAEIGISGQEPSAHLEQLKHNELRELKKAT